MSENISNLLYLVSIVSFILALKFLSSPTRARRGNQIGAAGMLLAIGVTLAKSETGGGLSKTLDPGTYWLIAIAAIIGSVIGALAGSFVGALLGEYSTGTSRDGATRAATGATIGRAIAMALKVAAGCIVAAWLVAAALL